jgi:hypothetical protein
VSNIGTKESQKRNDRNISVQFEFSLSCTKVCNVPSRTAASNWIQSRTQSVFPNTHPLHPVLIPIGTDHANVAKSVPRTKQNSRVSSLGESVVSKGCAMLGTSTGTYLFASARRWLFYDRVVSYQGPEYTAERCSTYSLYCPSVFELLQSPL